MAVVAQKCRFKRHREQPR